MYSDLERVRRLSPTINRLFSSFFLKEKAGDSIRCGSVSEQPGASRAARSLFFLKAYQLWN